MKRKKKKKHRFTEEEKRFITQLKHQLFEMDVPRTEWSSIIQQELHAFSQFTTNSHQDNKKSTLRKIIDTIKIKLEHWFFNIFKNRIIPKELRDAPNSLEGMYDIFEESMQNVSPSEQKIMNLMTSGLNINKKEIQGDHGTFIMDRPDRKKVIVSFDDDED